MFIHAFSLVNENHSSTYLGKKLICFDYSIYDYAYYQIITQMKFYIKLTYFIHHISFCNKIVDSAVILRLFI